MTTSSFSTKKRGACSLTMRFFRVMTSTEASPTWVLEPMTQERSFQVVRLSGRVKLISPWPSASVVKSAIHTALSARLLRIMGCGPSSPPIVAPFPGASDFLATISFVTPRFAGASAITMGAGAAMTAMGAAESANIILSLLALPALLTRPAISPSATLPPKTPRGGIQDSPLFIKPICRARRESSICG